MTYHTIETSLQQGVAVVRLNRPDVRNAFNETLIAELTDAFEAAGGDDAVRAVVLAANGKAFCAGADLNWMRKMAGYSHAENQADALKLARMLHAIHACPKPTVACVQGAAYAGGMGLVAACDVAIASTEASFCLSEVKLGLIPATIGPYVLARMGEDKARRVFMSARIFDAAEAQALNLLAYSVDPEDLDAAVEDEVTPYLQVAPKAVAAAKRLTRALGPRIDREVIDMSVDALISVWEDDEAPHGIGAFFAKEKPRWQG